MPSLPNSTEDNESVAVERTMRHFAALRPRIQTEPGTVQMLWKLLCAVPIKTEDFDVLSRHKVLSCRGGTTIERNDHIDKIIHGAGKLIRCVPLLIAEGLRHA